MTARWDLIRQKLIAPYIRESDYAIRKPWISHERRLLDYLIVYVQEGHCRFWVDNVPYDFHDGEFCLIQPGSLNILQGLTETVTPFAHLDIFFNPIREESFPTRPGQTDLSVYEHLLQPRLDDLIGESIPVKLQPREPAKFASVLSQMVECWMQHDPFMEIRAQSLAFQLIVMMIQDHVPHNSTVRTSPDSLNWIPSYLSMHLAEPLSVENIAKRANLSPSWFSTLFKRTYGVSPHQFLLGLRINHAADLLRTTELSIENIAIYCGFADVYHFSKSFRNKMGESPTEFRKQLSKSRNS